MENYQNEIQTLEYNENESFLTQTWTRASKAMNEEEFKTEMLQLVKFIEQFQPHKLLIDMRNFYFIVIPELQEWINTNVNSLLAKMNETKTAYIVSSDLFASVSVEQTVEESAGKLMTTMFFEGENEARKWLDNK